MASVEASSNPVGEVKADFSNISLDADPESPKKKKVPRRLIYCSDGVLEEYSTDEEEQEAPPPEPTVNPKELTWLPWFWYYIVSTAKGSLSVADTCGEKLAWFFGITTPKYQYAIDEYYRLKEEEERDKQNEEKRLQMLEEKKLKQVKVQTEQKSSESNVEKF